MKGIVFTEFLDMVEKEFGYETVDHIIENSELSSNGIYTCLLYTSPSPRDQRGSRMPSSA